MSLQRKARHVKKKGIVLGTRLKENKKVYIYMLGDLFFEIIYKDDNTDNEAERINILKGLKDLKNHLEQEFRTTF